VDRGGGDARVRTLLPAGLALIALAIALTLSRSPPVLAGTNSVAPSKAVVKTRGDSILCQADEDVPAGTIAVRLWVHANVSPAVTALVRAGSRTLAKGRAPSGRLTATIAVPIARLARAAPDAEVCFEFGPAVETILLIGESSAPAHSGAAPYRVRVEYLRPGRTSWWAMAGAIARRLGLGRAPSGSWVWLLPILLMACAVALTVRLLARQLGGAPAEASPAAGAGRRRVSPMWICAAVACLSAISWSILTPPFQVPDEPSHFAYVQQLAETGSLPTSGASSFSEEEEVAREDLRQREVQFNPAVGTIASVSQQERLEHDLAQPLSRRPTGAGVAASEPPLYYALETVPYLLGSSGTLLDRLALMRLLSALMAGATALFVFLFLREALPRVSWAWTVGALAAASSPLLGFMSGAVNPEAMFCALGTALLYCLARAFRRRLTGRLAAAIAALVAAGLLSKLNFIALLPGTALALALLARRAASDSTSALRRCSALVAAPLLAPCCLYACVNLLAGRPALGLLSAGVERTVHHGSIAEELSYIWQFYLPRLPGMAHDFPGVLTTQQLWFDRLIGMYGWLDTYFPNWVYEAALVPAAAIALLAARAALAERARLRARAGELLCYLLTGAGLLALIGADAYLSFPASNGGYAEPRYLLPTIALYAAVLALAARGAGRRWGPAAGTLIVLLVAAHDIFSQLLLVGRYYG